MDSVLDVTADVAPWDSRADVFLDIGVDAGEVEDVVDLDEVTPPEDIQMDLGDVTSLCDPLDPMEPLILSLNFQGSPGLVGGAVNQAARVSYSGSYCCDMNYDWEVHLDTLDGTGKLIMVGSLPQGYRPPLRVGEEVFLSAHQNQPWWVNTYVAVWGQEGDLRFYVAHGSGWDQPAECGPYTCPRVQALESNCEAIPNSCGTMVVPPLQFSQGWPSSSVVLNQGEVHVEVTSEITAKYFAVESRHQVIMNCDDYPDDWMSAVFLDNSKVSQCQCNDRFDCRPGEVCETDNHRCVPDLCMADGCLAPNICDPYTGECFPPPPGPLETCETNDDCKSDSSCGSVCNIYTGLCVERMCCLVDCMGSCSDLMKGCFGCYSDCDCGGEGQQCNDETHQCQEAKCNEDKINFDATNAPMYEFYELCIPKNLDGPLMVLQSIDPSLYCGVSGGFVGCDPATETGCHGDLAFVPGTKQITSEKWDQLCQLSLLDFVSKIGGGHFIY